MCLDGRFSKIQSHILSATDKTTNWTNAIACAVNVYDLHYCGCQIPWSVMQEVNCPFKN